MARKKKEEEIIYDDDEVTEGGFFRKFFFILILIICVVLIYSRYIGTSGLILKDYNIYNEKIAESYNGFKIVHFSDFHYGRTTSKKELKNLVNKININKPDIVIFSGDFIDKDVHINEKDAQELSSILSKIESVYGNYFVTGNHDIKNDYNDYIFTNSNFISLDNRFELIYNKNNNSILLAGLGYKNNGEYLNEVLQNNNVEYKILVMHTPDTFDKIKDYNFDLVLAGHSHGGQVRIPMYGAVITPVNAKKYYEAYYKINNTDFYISSGIGTSTLNFRLFNRPSYNLYRLEKK